MHTHTQIQFQRKKSIKPVCTRAKSNYTQRLLAFTRIHLHLINAVIIVAVFVVVHRLMHIICCVTIFQFYSAFRCRFSLQHTQNLGFRSNEHCQHQHTTTTPFTANTDKIYIIRMKMKLLATFIYAKNLHAQLNIFISSFSDIMFSVTCNLVTTVHMEYHTFTLRTTYYITQTCRHIECTAYQCFLM